MVSLKEFEVNRKNAQSSRIWPGEIRGHRCIPGIDIKAYVDKMSNRRKKFQTASNQEVLSPKEFFCMYSPEKVYVIVCAGYENEQRIRYTLAKHGFRWGIDAFSWSEFENRHHGYLAMHDNGYL